MVHQRPVAGRDRGHDRRRGQHLHPSRPGREGGWGGGWGALTADFRAGISYLLSVRVLVIMTVMQIIVDLCLATEKLMFFYARDTLGLDASGLGYLMAAVGCGAVVGGLGLSAAGDLPRKGLLAAASAVLFGAVLGTFVVVRSVRGTALLFFVMGILQTVCVASLNTTIQLAVDDGMRGRIMSMMTVILFGFATTGGLVVGLLGDHIGVPSALAAGGGVIMVAAIALFVRAPELVGALPRAVEA